MSRGKIFHTVGGLKPGRSAFDLSYSKLFDCDMGQLIPVYCEEMVPGDKFKMSNSIVCRLQPLLAPILHEISITTHYFFVPERVLSEKVGFDYESFITGGKNDDFSLPPPLCSDFMDNFNEPKHSLWDYLGLPIADIPMTEENSPTAWPILGYNLIYNEYYRDQDLQEEVALQNRSILRRAWTKDYFTSSRPFVMRGEAPALPIDTFITADLDAISDVLSDGSFKLSNVGFTTNTGQQTWNSSPESAAAANASYSAGLKVNTDVSGIFNAVSTSFTWRDLTLAAQITKWKERNARAGVRLNEFIKAHWGEDPGDARLQRPEYIGGTKAPIIISEVLQTSETSSESPQGSLAGHGIAVDNTYIGKYRAREYGWIIGLLSIMPKPSYSCQGIPRQFTRKTRYQYPMPEWMHVGERAILNSELFLSGDPDVDNASFSFGGIFDELRVKNNMAVGNMRDTFSYWHLSRSFADTPALNGDFIECNPDKRIFAVPSEPGFIINYSTNCKALRPLPFIAEPGLVDHF